MLQALSVTGSARGTTSNVGTFRTRGSAFNPGSYYSYSVADPGAVPAHVMSNAGVGKIDANTAAGL
jgi:pectate lyase